MLKKLFIITLLITKLAYSNTQLVGGFGFSSINTPVLGENNIAAKTIFTGIENHYLVNETDTLLVSALVSSTKGSGINYLDEIELQIGFQKTLNLRHYVTVGFHLTHLLNENFDNIQLAGAGFGLNLGYAYQVTPSMALNVQLYSNAYDLASDSTANLNVHTFRSFISIYPK